MADLKFRKKSLTETFSSSTDSSHEEEERLKMLFMSCDSNNDGRLDKKDLIMMCRKMNMLDLAEEIISVLGANSNGSSISFQEFLKCRAKVLALNEGECSRKKSAEYLVHSNFYNQNYNQYDQLAGSCSDVSQIYSSMNCFMKDFKDNLCCSGVDYDSGTQEIQEEPLNLFAMLQQFYGDLYCQWTASERDNASPSLSQQLLQCANQIHLSRINRLYSELKFAIKRFNNCHASQDNYQKEITRHQKDRERLKQELQNQTSRYEDRLTELHSVIAELQKKIERKDRNTIMEEDEDILNDENEVVDNADYEKLNLRNQSELVKESTPGNTFHQLSCSTSFVESSIFGADKSTAPSEKPMSNVNFVEVQTDIACAMDSRTFNIQKNDRSNEKLQEATEKQLKAFHHNHIFLQEKLSNYENVVCSLRTQLGSVLEERESLRKQLKDLQDCVELNSVPLYSQQSSCSMSKISLDSKSTSSSSSSPARPIMGVRQQQSKQNQIKPQNPETDWVMKVVTKYQKSLSNPTQSIFINHIIDDSHSILTSGLVFLQELSENIPYPALVEPCKRISLEWQRLVANSDRESADKLLLQTTLAESKSIADQLQCSIVQSQSDCAALARSNFLADQIIELADILIQLQETDPLGSGLDITHQSLCHEATYENNSLIMSNEKPRSTSSCGDFRQLRHGFREQIESAAKLLIYRFECYSSMGRQTPDSGAGVSSTLSSGGGSVDVESVMRQASSTGDWTKADELKLRQLFDQLRLERHRARLSIVGFHLNQSYYGQCLSSSNQSSLHRNDIGKLPSNDFENQISISNQNLIESAILLQELCSLKEERANLKTRIYLLEKEAKSIQLALDSKSACEKSLKVQLNQMMQHRTDFISGTDESRRLKAQIEDLLQALEELRERCQVQQRQNEEFVNDLKKANAALILAFDKAKKKYQNKISRLEGQLSANNPGYHQQSLLTNNSTSDETAL